MYTALYRLGTVLFRLGTTLYRRAGGTCVDAQGSYPSAFRAPSPSPSWLTYAVTPAPMTLSPTTLNPTTICPTTQTPTTLLPSISPTTLLPSISPTSQPTRDPTGSATTVPTKLPTLPTPAPTLALTAVPWQRSAPAPRRDLRLQGACTRDAWGPQKARKHTLADVHWCVHVCACVLFVRTSWASMVPTKAFSSGSQKNAICCFAHAVVGPMTCGVPA